MISNDKAIAEFNRVYREAGSVSEALVLANSAAHLISPATVCDVLPEGFSIVMSTVVVDIDRETYPTLGGDDDDRGRKGDPLEKRALGKTAIDRIAMSAGVSWDPRESGRLDNGRDPHYARYRAVGTVRQFDGQTVTLVDEREMDLREGCAQVESIRAKARSAVRPSPDPRKRDGSKQIAELRQHILSHAITKARLRAVRTLGIRSWYTRSELQVPFVVARLMATGHSDDPALRRDFAMLIMGNALASARNLYGESTSRSPVVSLAAHEPPPVHSTLADEDGIDVPAASTSASDTTVGAVAGCEYCGVVGAVQKIQAPKGMLVHCGSPKCHDLATADRDREIAAVPPAYPQTASAPKPTPAGAPAPPHAPSSTPEREEGRRGASQPSGYRVPGNRGEGGQPIEVASDRTLRWWVTKLTDTLASGQANPRYAENDRRILAAMEAELERRTNPVPSGTSGATDSIVDPIGEDDIPF